MSRGGNKGTTGGTALVVDLPGTAGPLTPSVRADVLSICTQGAMAGCDAVRLAAYGEEIARLPLGGEEATELAERVRSMLTSDLAGREHGRHVYKLAATRDGHEVYSCAIRLRGGESAGPGLATSVEPSASGALRMVLGHQHAMLGTFLKGHASTVESQSREIDRLRERNEKLEEQNDKLRAELREIIDGARLDTIRAETERDRQKLIHEAGRQLLQYLPFALRTWLPQASPEVLGTPAPAAVLASLASIVDAQLDALRPLLSEPQLAIVVSARAGKKITVADLAPFSTLSDAALCELPNILRPDQLEPLVSAMESAKGGGA